MLTFDWLWWGDIGGYIGGPFAELGYQLLALATSHLVGDNREFKVLGIF